MPGHTKMKYVMISQVIMIKTSFASVKKEDAFYVIGMISLVWDKDRYENFFKGHQMLIVTKIETFMMRMADVFANLIDVNTFIGRKLKMINIWK